jgi:subtilisin
MTGEPDGRAAAVERPARPRLTWRLDGQSAEELALDTDWAEHVTRDWAWHGATGRGVSVCIVDSGVDPDHPRVGPIQGSYAVTRAADGGTSVVRAEPGDAYGHGTACASIVRSIAPECDIHSVRVLDNGAFGTGEAFLTGLRWAIEQGYDVVNLSLSTTRRLLVGALHELADEAYFGRSLIVASAHNRAMESFPWRFSSVVSVGSHGEPDPDLFLYNPNPPVEFFAHGVNVDVAWTGGQQMRCTGNSFATPHITGYAALALSKHPGLRPFQVKTVLFLTAVNVRNTR